METAKVDARVCITRDKHTRNERDRDRAKSRHQQTGVSGRTIKKNRQNYTFERKAPTIKNSASSKDMRIWVEIDSAADARLALLSFAVEKQRTANKH